MKKLIYVVLIAALSLTVAADIYTWNTGELLTYYSVIPFGNYEWSFLEYADLHGANLWGANLSHANLSYADLHQSNLSDTNLTHALLIEADLSFANLSLADLSYADLTGADLSGANLYGVQRNDTIFKDALYNSDTIFSSSFDPTTEDMIFVPEPTTLMLFGLGGLLIRKK